MLLQTVSGVQLLGLLVLQSPHTPTLLQANPDLEAKNSMLHIKPALYQLYKDLVVGGLITADEFWANRLHGVRKPVYWLS